ncbi:mechanosensitive ion channel family protein [Candidatus Micrarchaeota archaeon]|nr:mechanosensitive ion channel family protein [Candidatus Micrarchaeota archaeon]
MDLTQTAIITGEIIFLAIIGLALGKILHKALTVVFKSISHNTKTSLDDFIFQSIQGPLEVTTTVVSIYFTSTFFKELGGIQTIIEAYSLSITILLAFYTLAEVVGAVLRWYYFEGKDKTKLKMDVTLLPFFRKFSRLLIMLIGVSSSLAVIGIDLTGLLAVTSVVALILGLASQETLANIFAGMALQLDRPFIYGDYLKLASGEVVKLEKIGTRSTKLSDLNGNTMILSNSEFAKQRIINLSKPTNEFKTSIQVDVPLKFNYTKMESELSKQSYKPVKITIEKISKEYLTINISFWVQSFEELANEKARINQEILHSPDFFKK